jgi:hypothetical protein
MVRINGQEISLEGNVKNKGQGDQRDKIRLTPDSADMVFKEIAHDDFMEYIPEVENDNISDKTAQEKILFHNTAFGK